MTSDRHDVQQDRQLILDSKSKGRAATFWAYTKLSGPGWLQSAITLGGGSLASSLYLGVLAGYSLLWLQPLAMILGIVMLSAISYVTLSTGERPFRAINTHINPVLGWGWAIATLMANCVWSLPQFALGTAAVRQNLMPDVFGGETMDATLAKAIVAGSILVICTVMVWFYDSGKRGVQVFNWILKLMVGLIVISFFGVVVRMSIVGGLLNWGEILAGFVPDVRLLFSPAETFQPLLDAVGEDSRDFWRQTIIGQQRNVMISAAATAVGINMTFLLPYSMLRRGWDRAFRGLAVFDLSTGLFIPFVLATSCVVIASASRFHTKVAEGFVVKEASGKLVEFSEPDMSPQTLSSLPLNDQYRLKSIYGKYQQLVDKRNEKLEGQPAIAEKRLAATLVKRDAANLAQALSPLTGDFVANYVFGFGVVGMAVSSIIILMLINGFTVCEMLGRESHGWLYRLGCMMPCIGILGPFIWGGQNAQFWLAIPTSMFGMVLLPVAYFAFFLLMNERAVLGDDMLRGGRRIAWNVLMAIAAGFASLGSLWSLWTKLKWYGIALFVGFLLLAAVVQVIRKTGKTT